MKSSQKTIEGERQPGCYSITPGTGRERLLEIEWLLTNALGSFAMGTALGVPTRRYHSYLNAAAAPPVGRIGSLHSIVEQLLIDPGSVQERTVDLTTYEFARLDSCQTVFHPAGQALLVEFNQPGRLTEDPSSAAGWNSVSWTYRVEHLPSTIEIIKQVSLTQGENECRVRYALRQFVKGNAARSRGEFRVRLRLRPLVALYDMHELRRRPQIDRYEIRPSRDGVSIALDGRRLEFTCVSDGAPAATMEAFRPEAQWWENFHHRVEADRHQDCRRDLFSPGEFAIERVLAPGGGAAREIEVVSAAPLDQDVRAALGRNAGGAELSSCVRAAVRPGMSREDRADLAMLVRAAGAYVVRRAPVVKNDAAAAGGSETQGGVSVIAGYPWFSDWGRDTFISLPGLLLVTGRHAEARAVLHEFAARRSAGLIPNVFSDQTGHAEYNTVDGSLWFIHAASAYLDASGDQAALAGPIGQACLDIIEHYRRGVNAGFSIAMDPVDNLIAAGNESTQLTWMDARRDGVTFTPRHGKCVEINALWYSALMLVSEKFRKIDASLSANLNDLAGAVGRSFTQSFWNERGGCLYDVLTPGKGMGRWMPDDSIRPNQLLAVSLPRSALNKQQQRSVVACVREHLLTPMGIRTLAPSDPKYQGRYEGSLFSRDSAYHQGTAWPWLLGVYAQAVLRSADSGAGEQSRAFGHVRAVLEPTLRSLREPRPGTCIGQIPEIYDGSWSAEQPQRASGCPAQAWSVAQVLEAIVLVSASSQASA